MFVQFTTSCTQMLICIVEFSNQLNYMFGIRLYVEIESTESLEVFSVEMKFQVHRVKYYPNHMVARNS